MKLKKLISVLGISAFLVIPTAIETNSNNMAQAAKLPKKYQHMRSGHYVDLYGDFYVKITKPTYVYKIHWKSPMANSTISKAKLLKKGRKVHLMQPGVNFGWYIWGKGLGGNHKYNYTVKRAQTNYSWFKVISMKKY